MKKKIIRFITIILSIITCISFVGCNKPGSGANAEDTIYVYNYNGGFGTQWLYRARDAYQKLHPDVKININPQKPITSLSSSDIKVGRDELWFIEMSSYYTYWADGALESISPAVTTPNPYDGGKTVVSKLTDTQDAFYKINGEYFAIPHYSGYMGLIYNVDTFEDNGFYFTKNKPTVPYEEDPDGYFTKNSEDYSAGPDGEFGTYDDGLPATYDDFLNLLDYMSQNGFVKSKGKSPLISTGAANEQYIGETLYSFMVDYEGIDQMKLNFTFDGQATDLGKIVNGQFVKDANPTTITAQNGYELSRQQGKYEAFNFFNEIFSDYKNYDNSVMASSTFKSRDAVRRLIRGEAGILMEGCWWEEENLGLFSQLNKDKHDFRFAVMPFPKATEDKIGEKSTIYDHNASICFMKSGLSDAKKEMIYDFIQFLYSDEWLIDFTATTGTRKALNYDIPESALNNLTHYEKTLVDFYSKSDILYPGSANKLYYNNQASTFRSYYYMTSKINDENLHPITYLVDYRINGKYKNPSSTTYFNGLYDYYSSIWPGLVSVL